MSVLFGRQEVAPLDAKLANVHARPMAAFATPVATGNIVKWGYSSPFHKYNNALE